MSDVAAGSSAALQLQQNMAAAPDVQQAQNMAMQGAQLKLQQDQANLEKTKLANLVGETGFQSSKESKLKLQALSQDPKFKAADDATKLRMAAMIDIESGGDVDKLTKNLQAAEIVQAKELANQAITLNNQAREVTKAAAVINAVAPEKIGETFDRLPEANRKAVYDQIGGEQAWKALSNTEKKAVLNNLMMNGERKIAAQALVIEEEKQKAIAASREKVANINATWHMNNKAAGGSKEDLATFRAYTNKVASDNKRFTGSESRLTKAISDAKVLYEGALLTNNTKAAKEAKSEMDSRMADLKDLRTRQLKNEISNATMLPDGTQRTRIMAELDKQAEVLGIKSPSVDTPKPDIPSGAKTHDGYPARKNADGSYSTEVSITVTNPKLNSGKPTNIPSLWKGKEVDENTAVENALATGKKYESFSTIPDAVKAAKERSKAGGAGATSNKYTEQNPAKPTSKEEYDKLPPNSYYMQDGVLKRKKG
jgi:hypothetical protein